MEGIGSLALILFGAFSILYIVFQVFYLLFRGKK